MKKIIAVAAMCIACLALLSIASIEHAADRRFESGPQATKAAAALLAARGAAPYRICANHEATRVLVHGKNGAENIGLEVIKVDELWRIRDASLPESWSDGPCHYN